MTLSISLNFLPLMEITQLRSRLSETFSMSTHDDLLNGATQKDRKCVAFVSSHRVSQFCLLLFVALSLFQGCSGSMLPFTAPRGTLWLGSARNNPQRFAAAKLKWLNALQETNSDNSETVSDEQELRPLLTYPGQTRILHGLWTDHSAMVERLNSLTGNLPSISSDRMDRLESLVGQLSDKYSSKKNVGEIYPSDVWSEEGPVNGEMEQAAADQANLVAKDPLKRAETHYKERLARLT